MEMIIHANETETVLEALESYREQLKREITTLTSSSDFSCSNSVERLHVKRETLTRVIDRIDVL